MRRENKLRGQSIFSMKHIWKVLLFFIVFCSSQKVEGQFKKIGNFKDTIAAITSYENNLYAVVHAKTKSINYTDTLKIVCWKDNIWQTVATLPYIKKNGELHTSRAPVSAIYFLKDELYLVGSFDSLPGLSGRTGFVAWDGTLWRTIELPINFNFLNNTTTAVWDNKLWLNYTSDAFVRFYDGEKWITASKMSEPISGNYTRLDTFNSKLYFFGYFQNAQNLAIVKEPFFWNDTIWQKTSDFSFDSSKLLNAQFFYNMLKYKSGYIRYRENHYFNQAKYTDSVEYFDGKSFHLLNKGFLNSYDFGYTRDIINYNSKLYRVGLFIKNGVNTNILVWDSTEWIPLTFKMPGLNLSIITKVITIDNELLIVTDNYGNHAQHDSTYVLSLKNLIKLSGYVYEEVNKNCIKDASEKTKGNVFIEISPGPNYINTNDSGKYEFYAGFGEFKLKVIPKKYWKQVCPANDSSIIIETIADSNYEGIDFAISPKYPVQDIRLTLTGSTGWRARQGFTENYTLCYENVGTTKASGKIALKLDSAFTNFSSTPSPKSYTYPFAEWEFDSLEIGEKKCITFKARLDSATINDSVTLIAAFDGGDGWIDNSMNDNSDTLKQRVVAALDPNDKTSYPDGDITKETKEIRYQIRFQNVGTDTAYRVTVIDTIDTNLPLTKVMMNSASHKYKLDIKNNVFKWTFDGIMLPDDKTNEPLSNGFINYTAQIKPGLAIGTEIKNTAYIYFDYQKPVITNTARSKMTEPVGIRKEKAILGNSLNIYPNPASSKVYLKNTGGTKKHAIVFNSIGQQLQTLVLQPQDITEWNINHLPNGLYFIQADDEQTLKFLIQH